MEDYQQVFPSSLTMDVTKLVEFAKDAIYGVVQKVSKVNGVKAKMDALEMNMRMVSAKKADISDQLEQEERRPAKKRKREVDVWIHCVESLEGQVHKLGRKVKEGRFLSHFKLEDQVSDLATQVERLHDKGRFDNGLTLDVQPAQVYELQPGEPEGQASRTRYEILDHLINDLAEILGLRGAGATSLGKNIVQDWRRFDGACLVTVQQEGTVN
ncbi:uncharacterized protein LOC115687648 isoform X1 [Syzygium oleosum]|uniref:uncharacterized protein LOC115687648 isoform X1 n=2 Tax=Syzygium oleosum TaxID=219896 RepID=UPI0011D19410|nr:uncharacterized protein LOC115687648 isoform X1 [Syzygium oleosum]